MDLFFFIHALRQQQPGVVATYVSCSTPLVAPSHSCKQSSIHQFYMTYMYMYMYTHSLTHTHTHTHTYNVQEQYKFCFTSVLEFLDSFDHYSNFD